MASITLMGTSGLAAFCGLFIAFSIERIFVRGSFGLLRSVSVSALGSAFV
jgi:hypothetical protein